MHHSLKSISSRVALTCSLLLRAQCIIHSPCLRQAVWERLVTWILRVATARISVSLIQVLTEISFLKLQVNVKETLITQLMWIVKRTVSTEEVSLQLVQGLPRCTAVVIFTTQFFIITHITPLMVHLLGLVQWRVGELLSKVWMPALKIYSLRTIKAAHIQRRLTAVRSCRRSQITKNIIEVRLVADKLRKTKVSSKINLREIHLLIIALEEEETLQWINPILI